ncbi:MAG: zinc-ribbon domain-containing protein, partial [Clostridia bacterium]|nr:zinc-ribbon domain-containing protein [Clostridia bacterium]
MNKKPKIGYNDLQTLFPSIAKEFHPEKNGGLKACDFFAKSNKKVWWICPKGHEYEMVINNRTGINKSGCPICTGKRIVKGINDLFTTNPDLIDKWDYE